MNQPTDASKATLDHTSDTTGRDGAIDFAAGGIPCGASLSR
jgi:hypothetical protein